MKGFLYGQTEYNLLKGSVKLIDYINKAKENNFNFLSITDPNLYGNYKFYNLCIKNNIKPIIGYEYSYENMGINSKILLYPKNNNGYKNLLKIVTDISLGKEINIENIKNKNIYLIYVFNDSYISYLLKNDLDLISYLKEIADDDSFVGYSFKNDLDEKDNNLKIINLCKGIIKAIPIHQMLYLNSNDAILYETLSKIDNNNIKLSISMDYSFNENPIEDEILNNFINSIDVHPFDEKNNLPKFPINNNMSSKEYLSFLCNKGLIRRLNGKLKNNYKERLDYELNVIDKMGYNDYFLIVWDFINYSRKNDILVGPGRGSACGSLVAYCLGITEIDPIRFNLYFERFLNPERISMPDIDTDFPDDKRDDVIKYVQSVFGEDHVSTITAFNTFQLKSAIIDVSKAYNLPNDKIKYLQEYVSNVGYEKAEEEFKNRNEDLYLKIIQISHRLESLPKFISTHAAGIILSNKPLTDIIALCPGTGNIYQSSLEQKDLESLGLLKMDFLSISNLTMIKKIMDKIGFTIINLRSIPLNDKKTFDMLSSGDTLGIFQLESRGITNVIMKMKINSILDIVSVLALYRPGPMKNIDEFILRKHGKKFSYLHPNLEPILKETYGIIVYQEQIMKIAQVFAGYSLAEADILRRAISKKKVDILKSMEEDFISKSYNNGYDKNLSKKIYDLIYEFADYGFNKAHSVGYTMIAYIMAYLKVHYYNVFMSIMMNNALGSAKDLKRYINYAKSHGLETLKPNVNISTANFEYDKNMLFMPLTSIKSIGPMQAKRIIEERNKNGYFKDYYDFIKRIKPSKSELEALIFSGALDLFGLKKSYMIDNSSDNNLLDVKEDKYDEYDIAYLRNKEFEYLNFNLTYDIFKGTELISRKYNITNISNLKINQESNLLIIFEDLKIIKTKNTNEEMAFGSISDGKNELRFVIFTKNYKELNNKLIKSKLYVINGRLEFDKDKNSTTFIINKILFEPN